MILTVIICGKRVAAQVVRVDHYMVQLAHKLDDGWETWWIDVRDPDPNNPPIPEDAKILHALAMRDMTAAVWLDEPMVLACDALLTVTPVPTVETSTAEADALLLAESIDSTEAGDWILIGDGIREVVARVLKAAGKTPQHPETRALTVGVARFERDPQDEDEGQAPPLLMHYAPFGTDRTLCFKPLPITDEGAARLHWTNNPSEATCPDCIVRFDESTTRGLES